MPLTPDSKHGPSYEEGIYMSETSLATEAGELRYASGRWSLYDGTGEYDPRAGVASPTAIGQVLISLDGVAFTAQSPLVSDLGGVITNDNGHMVVQG